MDKPNRQIKITFDDNRNQRKENEFKKAEEEIAATAEREINNDDILFASDPSNKDNANYLRNVLKNKSNRNKKFIVIPKHFFFPIALALFIGISLGVIILKMFSTTGQTEDVPVNGNGTPAVVDQGDEEEDPPNTKSPVTSDLPSLAVNIIQIGVYSSQAKADEIIQEVKNNGLVAASLENEGLFYVFVGVTSTKDQAMALSSNYSSANEEDPYVKEFVMKGGTFSSTDSNKVALVENAAKEYSELVLLTSAALTTGSFDEKKWSEVKEMITSLEGIASSIETLTSEEKTFVTNVINAGKSFNEYKESGQASHLWASEQHLLNALTVYGLLFK
ncbi:hypothetical protein CIB95_05755 [Lottiidibacillus patelloidae]|uniref:SPOR domain-containing protein n=1 Tax=Lottiidibacillus patelloidae TaxID=2670334 RepID=A0A263BVT0_9BACI|nr:SPOR domain-containing protein [Lottiidibacillus patelloidae]OZM57861.1 hypothetical protein CIB95_05755 [Lottiidibacillus patelloidae]